MLTEPTLDKLKELSLYGMADAYLEQKRKPSAGGLSFEDRFGLLLILDSKRQAQKEK